MSYSLTSRASALSLWGVLQGTLPTTCTGGEGGTGGGKGGEGDGEGGEGGGESGTCYR